MIVQIFLIMIAFFLVLTAVLILIAIYSQKSIKEENTNKHKQD